MVQRPVRQFATRVVDRRELGAPYPADDPDPEPCSGFERESGSGPARQGEYHNDTSCCIAHVLTKLPSPSRLIRSMSTNVRNRIK